MKNMTTLIISSLLLAISVVFAGTDPASTANKSSATQQTAESHQLSRLTDNYENVIFFEDFDAYIAGIQLSVQNPTDWVTWSGTPGTVEDPVISNTYFHSDSNSVQIIQDNDIVHPIGNYTSGFWKVSFWAYIPNGKAGYYNTLAEFVPPATFNWAMQVYFNVGGMGQLDAGGWNAATFTYNYDTWMYVEVLVDLDNDWAEFVLDNVSIYSWQWTLGVSGSGSPLQLAATDLYGATVDDEMYVDDYQVSTTDYEIVLTPYNAPIQIPATGGTFDYNAQLINNTNVTQNFYAVLLATLPNGSQYGPIDPTPYSAHLSPGQTIDVDLTQNVPGNAPAGDYTFYCLVGTSFNNIVDSSGFNFTKLGTFQAVGTEKWIGYYSAVGAEMMNYDLWTVDGIYREDGTLVYGTMSSPDEISLPGSFVLHQNYPNPFNPVTAIKFDLQEALDVNLVIYDLLSHEIATLVNDRLNAGYHNVVWNGTDRFGRPVSTGMYIYQVTAGEFTSSKKMLLLK